MRLETKNMQAKPINQKRGPTTGNENTGTKRADAMAAKAKSGSEKSEIADMITGAVARRGELMRGFRDPAVEGLHATTNTGRGPTRGNAGKTKSSTGGRRGALGATSGY